MAYKLLGTDQASALFLKQNSSIPLINQALLKYQMNKIHQGHLLTNKQNRAGEEKEVFDINLKTLSIFPNTKEDRLIFFMKKA